MQLWHLYRTLIISSLIIHRKVTCCQPIDKQTQIKLDFGTVTNTNTENSTMAFISKTDNFLINYS